MHTCLKEILLAILPFNTLAEDIKKTTPLQMKLIGLITSEKE